MSDVQFGFKPGKSNQGKINYNTNKITKLTTLDLETPMTQSGATDSYTKWTYFQIL